MKTFFTQAHQQAWYANTLFVLVADHGHRLPLNRDYLDPACRRIPVLMFGPALTDSLKGKVNHRISAQHDLPATLLHVLGMDSQAYTFSRNMFGDPGKGFAYLNQDQAITWLTPGDTARINLGAVKQSAQNPSEAIAMAYLQYLYETFLGL
jgi:phosphoglycerol transferase MdoB-like AlkP superfamily enzyme